MLRAIFSIGFLQLLTLIVNVGRAKALAVVLGPAGFGVVATIDQLVQSTAQLSNFSIPFTALKFLSHRHSLGERAFARGYVVFLRAMLALTALATLLTVLAVPALLTRIDPELARYTGVVRLGLLGLPAAMLVVFFVNVLAARQQSTRSVQLQLASALVIAVTGVVGCLLAGVRGVYLGAVPGASAVVLMAAVLLRPRGGHDAPSDAEPTALPAARRQVIRTAALTYLAVGCYAVLLLVARYVSLTAVGETGAGILQAALAAALSLGAVLGPANTLYLAPYVNRSLPAEDKLALTHRFVPRLFLIFCVAAIPVMVFPGLVVRVLYSARFMEAVALLPWFVAWQAIVQTANVYQQLLIGLDDVGWACAIIGGTHVVSTVLCVALVGPFGLPGVAAAFVIGGLSGLAATVIRVSVMGRGFPPRLGALIVGGAAGLVCLWGVAGMQPEATLAGIGWRGTLGTAYALILWLAAPSDFRREIVAGVTGLTVRPIGR